MRGRKPSKIVLKPKDKAILSALVQNGQTPLKVARRARILLSRADSKERVIAIGDEVEQDTSTVWRVCRRYGQRGLEAAVYDAPRSGRPRVFFQHRAPAD